MGCGNSFDIAYPQKARDFISKTLQERKITSIPTLYVLCGNPNASVSKECGILPLDLSSTSINKRFLEDTNVWLNKGIECVYFESGSGAAHPLNQDTVLETRYLIDRLKPEASLFVSGGIRNPAHARMFAGIADYVVIGGHFERNGVKDTNEFVATLKT